MANNPKRPGASASTSFRAEEIDAMNQLMDALYRGASPGVLLRSDAVKNVYAKFKRMQMRVRNARSES